MHMNPHVQVWCQGVPNWDVNQKMGVCSPWQGQNTTCFVLTCIAVSHPSCENHWGQSARAKIMELPKDKQIGAMRTSISELLVTQAQEYVCWMQRWPDYVIIVTSFCMSFGRHIHIPKGTGMHTMIYRSAVFCHSVHPKSKTLVRILKSHVCLFRVFGL